MIFDLSKAATKDGRPYIKMILSDSGGVLINAIMFDCNKLDFNPKKGDMVTVSAMLQQYNNQSQLKVNDMILVASGGTEAFLPKSKNNPKEMAEELRRLLQKHITSDYFQTLLQIFYDDTDTWEKFQIIPAAKSVHHAYVHGLMEHTLAMVRLAAHIVPLYPHVNKELLLIGALFHDLGKVRELDISAGIEYSDDGRLLGHIMLGYLMVNRYLDKAGNFPEPIRQQLLHLLASHHGALEFGSPLVPKTAEALLLNFIDDMDAKLNAVSSVFEKEDIHPGGWSCYNKSLERQLYYPPKDTKQGG
ncbi:MAG: HD domain-containing protein [Deferribacteraceae bacterium]|nr:HD domain-containing protein [Deferribacteraceae bacterium]